MACIILKNNFKKSLERYLSTKSLDFGLNLLKTILAYKIVTNLTPVMFPSQLTDRVAECEILVTDSIFHHHKKRLGTYLCFSKVYFVQNF